MESTGKRFLIAMAYLVVYMVLIIVAATRLTERGGIEILTIMTVFIGYFIYLITFDGLMDSAKIKTRIMLTILGSIFAVAFTFLFTTIKCTQDEDALFEINAFWCGMLQSPFLFGCLMLCAYYINDGMWENYTLSVIIPAVCMVVSILLCTLLALSQVAFVAFWIPFILGVLALGGVVFMTVKFGTPFH